MFVGRAQVPECPKRPYACPDVNSWTSDEEHTAMTGTPSVADYPAGARMAPRVIDDFEFVWMLRGQARFVTEDALALAPGRLLLVPAGVRHSFVWDERRSSRHGYVHFDPDRIGGRVAAEVRSRPMTQHDPLGGLCAYLLWLGQEQTDGWEQRANRTLRFLLELFTSEPLPSDELRVVLPAPLLAVVGLLRREWSQMPLRRLTVGELASAAHVSRSYLNRLFRTSFGISAAAALERLRCSRAETLLARTNMTIGSIAHQCGFADLYHFSHRFIRLYGLPPRRFRDEGSAAPSALDHAGVRRLAYAVWE
jgi:AraC-like DNA-binding protein